jgi:hypothetical protein
VIEEIEMTTSKDKGKPAPGSHPAPPAPKAGPPQLRRPIARPVMRIAPRGKSGGRGK